MKNTTGISIYQQQVVNSSVYATGNHFATKGINATSNHLHNALIGFTGHDFHYNYSSANTDEEPVYTNVGSTFKHIISTAGCGSRFTSAAAISTGDLVEEIDIITPMIGDAIDEDDWQTVDALSGRYRMLVDEGINNFMWRDTTVIEIDSIEALLGHMEHFYDYDVILAGVYMRQHRYQDALDLLDGLPNEYVMSQDEEQWMANIRHCYATLKEMYEGTEWPDIDQSAKEDIYDMITNDDYTGRHFAKQFMRVYDGEGFDPEIVWVEETGNKTTEINKMAQINSRVYPNPVKDVLNIPMKSTSKDATISITDVTGRTLLQNNLKDGNNRINLSSLTPGVYIAVVNNSSTPTETFKIIKE